MEKKSTKGKVKLTSNIRITVRDLKGNITEQVTLKNTITNLLFNMYRDALEGTLGNIDDLEIRRCAIGDDDGSILALAVTNTTLGNEVFRCDNIISSDATVIGTYECVFYLSPLDYAGAIEEVGWFSGILAAVWGAGAGKDSGTLMARVFWTHTKTALESIQFERVDNIVEA